MNYEDFRESVLADMEAQGISKEELRAAFIEQMETTEEWKILYPRIYQGAGGYGSPKRAAETYYMAIDWMTNNAAIAPAAFRAIYCATCAAKEHAFPLFFVDAQLLSAVLNTSTPSGLLWSEMKLPFEAGVFCLPRGALRYIDGSEVNHLGWLRARKGEAFRFSKHTPTINADNDAFLTYAQVLNDVGTVLFSNLNADERPYIDDSEISDLWRGTFDLPLASGDDEFLRQCRALVFGLLLAMDARSQLVSYGRREGKQSKKNRREFWTPNIIGRGFKVGRQSSGEKESHASPRLHWRRGHFRAQRHGTGLQQVKTIWLEPMLVGGSEGDEEQKP